MNVSLEYIREQSNKRNLMAIICAMKHYFSEIQYRDIRRVLEADYLADQIIPETYQIMDKSYPCFRSRMLEMFEAALDLENVTSLWIQNKSAIFIQSIVQKMRDEYKAWLADEIQSRLSCRLELLQETVTSILLVINNRITGCEQNINNCTPIVDRSNQNMWDYKTRINTYTYHISEELSEMIDRTVFRQILADINGAIRIEFINFNLFFLLNQSMIKDHLKRIMERQIGERFAHITNEVNPAPDIKKHMETLIKTLNDQMLKDISNMLNR